MFVSFLGMLTMQVGVLVLATSFITNAVCSLMTNLLLFRSETLSPALVIMTFCLFIIATWSVAFNGAYRESLNLIKIAHIMWSIYLCAWLVAVVCSGFAFAISIVCVDDRCPETMWLVANPRIYLFHNDESKIHNDTTTTPKSNISTASTLDNMLSSTQKMSNHTMKKEHKLSRKQRLLHRFRASQEYQLRNDNHSIVNIVVSVIVMLIYLATFLHAWIFLFNYKNHFRPKNDIENGTSDQKKPKKASSLPNTSHEPQNKSAP